MRRNKLNCMKAAQMLLDYESGIRGAELAAQYGVSQPTVWWWKKHYRGLDGKWIKHVRDQRKQLIVLKRRCKKLESILAIGTDVIKQLQPSSHRRSAMAVAIRAKFGCPRKSANRILGLSTSTRTTPKASRDDSILIQMMKSYFEQNPGQGFNAAFQAIIAQQPYTRSQATKVYRQCGYSMKDRSKTKIQVPRRVRNPMPVQVEPDQVWSMDFMLDVLPSGARYYVLNVIDDFNREAIVIKLMPRNTAIAVVQALEEIRVSGRTPLHIRSDNGGEFRSFAYMKWAKRYGITRLYSHPGNPSQNAYVERFNGSFRREVLSRYEFGSITEAQRMADDWRIRYNLSRPNVALGGLSPVQYAHAAQIRRAEESRAE